MLLASLVCLVGVQGARAQTGTALEAAMGTALGVDGGSGAFTLALSRGFTSRLAARPAVTLTAGRTAYSLEALFDLEGDLSVFVPYLVAGGGAVFGGSDTTAMGVWGLGLRGRINNRTMLLIEGRGFVVDEARAPSGALTIGLRWRLKDSQGG